MTISSLRRAHAALSAMPARTLLLTTLLDVLLIMALRLPIGPGVAALSLVPVIMAGWFYGWRGGLPFGLAFIPTSIVLMIPGIRGWDGWTPVDRVSLIVAFLPLALVGLAVGWLRDANRALRRQSAEHGLLVDALRASEERFRTVVLQSSEGITLLDEAGRVIEWNPWQEQHTGLSRAEVLGQYFWDVQQRLVLPERRTPAAHAARREKIMEALRSEQAPLFGRPLEFRQFNRSGELRDIEQVVFPIRTDQGFRLGSITRDITERKRAEAELREAKQLYESVFHLSPALIALSTEAEGRYLAVNDTFERLTGYARSEVIGRTSRELGVLAVPGERADLLRELNERGVVYNREIRLVRKSGEVGTGLLAMARLEVSGQPCLITIINDITEQKQAQQRAFELAVERERARLLARFVQDASHEFRTPLSVIGSSAYLIAHLSDASARQGHVEHIRREIGRITRLVEMLLLTVQLESGEAPCRAPMCLALLASQVGQRFAASHGSQPELRIELPHDLPPVAGDGEELACALSELLLNAYHFTPPEGTITLAAGAAEGQVWVEVRDTGPGILEEDLPRVFETFWRKDTAHSSPGFGLGLSIARRVAERHGGTISATSQAGHGAYFRLTLPAL